MSLFDVVLDLEWTVLLMGSQAWQTQELQCCLYNRLCVGIEILTFEDKNLLLREKRKPGRELLDISTSCFIGVAAVVEADIVFVRQNFFCFPVDPLFLPLQCLLKGERLTI